MLSVVLSRGSFSNTTELVKQYTRTRGRLIKSRLLIAFISEIELSKILLCHVLPGVLHHDTPLHPLYGHGIYENDDEDEASAY